MAASLLRGAAVITDMLGQPDLNAMLPCGCIIAQLYIASVFRLAYRGV
jgi:hypothetical protein